MGIDGNSLCLMPHPNYSRCELPITNNNGEAMRPPLLAQEQVSAQIHESQLVEQLLAQVGSDQVSPGAEASPDELAGAIPPGSDDASKCTLRARNGGHIREGSATVGQRLLPSRYGQGSGR